MDFGLILGYTYPVNELMGVYGSYYMGLSEITDDGGAKHSGISFGISYALPY